MQITNLDYNAYYKIFSDITPQDALNLKITCKTIYNIFAARFSTNVPSCQEVFPIVFKFTKLYPNFLDQSFKVNLVASILYDADALKEKTDGFIQGSCTQLLNNYNDGSLERAGFFQDQELFSWLEKQGFSKSLLQMQVENYMNTQDFGAIEKLCGIAKVGMKQSHHAEAIIMIFNQVFYTIILERAIKKLKKAVLEKPNLLAFLKEDISYFSSKDFVIDVWRYNNDLWDGFNREVGGFVVKFGRNARKNIDGMSLFSNILPNRLNQLVKEIERKV